MNDTKVDEWKSRASLRGRYFPVALQIPLLLAAARGLSGTAHKVIWAVIARSWAARTERRDGKPLGRAFAPLSAQEIARITHLDPSGVATVMRSLVARNILARKAGEVGLNQVYSAWEECWEPGDLEALWADWEPELGGGGVESAPGAGSRGRSRLLESAPGIGSTWNRLLEPAPGVQESAPGVQESAPGVQESAPGGSNARATEWRRERGEADPPSQPNSPNGQSGAWWDATPEPDPPQPTCTPDDVEAAKARARSVSDSNRKPARPI